MKDYFSVYKKSALFKMDDASLMAVLDCMKPTITTYKKGEYILVAHGRSGDICVVLEGAVRVIKEDGLGERVIVADMHSSGIFGESMACVGIESSPVSVYAAQNSVIASFAPKKIITPCQRLCPHHTKLIENLLRAVAQKNLTLNKRIDVLSKKSLRKKIMCYLLMRSEQANSSTFSTQFTREELADYLGANRSALCRELSKMKDLGLISFRGKSFEIFPHIHDY